MLRTHTSNIQSYVYEKYDELFNVFTIGACYRKDHDSTHLPMFHQYEIVCVNEKYTIKHLIACIKYFLSSYFNKDIEIRMRPSFFPFTEPSYEVDMYFNNNWLEILGCGFISPEVFKCSNTNYMHGFAIGGGLERILMIKYNIKDIRSLY